VGSHEPSNPDTPFLFPLFLFHLTFLSSSID
jgi:hypothetical protein